MISTAHRHEKLSGIKPFLFDFVKNKDSYLNRISQIRIGSLSEANGFFDEKGARELFYGHPTGEPQEGTRIPHAYYLLECPLGPNRKKDRAVLLSKRGVVVSRVIDSSPSML